MSSTRGLIARLVAALLVGVAGVVVLAFAVQAFDDGPKRTMRAKSTGQVDGRGRIASSFEMPRPTHAAAVGFELRPLVGTLAVSGRLDALPADVAPVIEVLPDGVIVRPAMDEARPPLAATMSMTGTRLAFALKCLSPAASSEPIATLGSSKPCASSC